MKLIRAEDYSVRIIRASTSDEVPLCEVMIAGAATGKILQGAVFEAALKWHDYTLLFLTDDVPFEEGLSIYLLDQHLNVADYARMYFIYSTGVFSQLDLSEDDVVRFHFLGEMVWTLKLYAEKRFVLPIVSTPLGVHRPLTFFRRFELSARQQDQEREQRRRRKAAIEAASGM